MDPCGGCPCNNPNYHSSKRFWPLSDVTAAGQTDCCWNIALVVLATSWQRCAFTRSKQNHNKHNWIWGLHFSTMTPHAASGWNLHEKGIRGGACQPCLAVVPHHRGSSSIGSTNISLSLWCWSGSRQLRWWGAALQVNKTPDRYLNQLWLKKLFDLKLKVQCFLSLFLSLSVQQFSWIVLYPEFFHVISDLWDDSLTKDQKLSLDRSYGHMPTSPIQIFHFFFLWVISIAAWNFLDNTYFVETPSAIPNGCPCHLWGAASDCVIGEDWVHTEAVAWWAIEKVNQRFPDVYPDLPYVSWVMNLCAKCVSGTQDQMWTFDLRDP